MANTFILIASDIIDFEGNRLTGEEAARLRLDNLIWPLYPGTRNRRKIQPQDSCIIYIAGGYPGAQSFIGEAIVKSIGQVKNVRKIQSQLAVEQMPDEIIEFESVQYFSRGVEIRPLLDTLSFIPDNRARWGAALQGGCRMISDTDKQVIIEKVS